MFNADTLDTFCFRWPACNCFVLVRVLPHSVALLPLKSRRAFLYFHNAPLPLQPSVQTVKRKPSRIQAMFAPWRNTLALSEQSSLSSDDDDDDDDDQEEEQRPCTLDNVLHNLPNSAWIHAQCSLTLSETDDRTVILTTKHSVIALEARSHAERRIFMNLVKLDTPAANGHRPHETISTRELMQRLQTRCQSEAEEMLQLVTRITRAKKEIVSHTDHLTELYRSCTALADSLHEYQSTEEHHMRLLHSIKEHTLDAGEDYNDFCYRQYHLNIRLAANPDIVSAARLRLLYPRSRTWRRYWIFTAVIFVIGLAAAALWEQ